MSFHLFIYMHVPFILHQCPLISFLKLWKWLYGLARGPSATNGYCSLNSPSNIWHCSKEICHKNERVRERERESELDAKWYGNCRKQGTTGWISLIGFVNSVNGRNSICLGYAKFNGLSCMVPGYRFWGPLSLYSVSCISLTKNSGNTKVVFNHFDRASYIYIYIYKIVIMIIIIMIIIIILIYIYNTHIFISDDGS